MLNMLTDNFDFNLDSIIDYAIYEDLDYQL